MRETCCVSRGVSFDIGIRMLLYSSGTVMDEAFQCLEYNTNA